MLRLCNIALTAHKSLLQSRGFIAQGKQIRWLFSRKELGIEGYEKARIEIEMLYVQDPFNFKQNFQQDFLQNKCDFIEFENGLKNLLHVIENRIDDIRTLKNGLYELLRKQKEYTGYKYNFGPIVMRALYFLDMPSVAIEFLEDEIIGQIFKENTGYQVLFDLLYEHKMYGDVLRIQENRKNKSGKPFQSKYIEAIVFAACYKINTPEAFEQSYDYYKEVAAKRDQHPFRKSLTFVAGLAIKQHRPQIALEILEPIFKEYHVTVRQIKLLAWTQMGQFDNVIALLESIILRHKKWNLNDQVTSLDVLNEIEQSFVRNGVEIEKFRAIRDKIESSGLVTKKTFDDLICEPFPEKLPVKFTKQTTTRSKQ